MDLNRIFQGIKKTKWIWILIFLITIPVDLFLTFSGGCFSPILVALATFGIPYFFGIKGVKSHLKAGTVIILIVGVLFGTLYTYFMYEQSYIFEPKSLSDTYLVDGTVSPYLGNESESFNYTVKFREAEPTSNFTVYVNITGLSDEKEQSIPLSKANGYYYNETNLGKDVYFYYFVLYSHENGTWYETTVGLGPITIPFSELIGLQILQGILILFLNSGLIFYLILGFYWWSKKSKEDRKRMEEEMLAEAEAKEKEGKDEFEVEEEEEFEEEEGEETEEEDLEGEEKDKRDEKEIKEKEIKEEVKGEYICTECGATVDADATKCPKCGEEFEEDEDEEDK